MPRRFKKDKDKRKISFTSRVVKKLDCVFCERNLVADFRNTDLLSQFISDRGKILNRGRSGVCAKHQRRLSVGIKRARHVAMLPFVVRT